MGDGSATTLVEGGLVSALAAPLISGSRQARWQRGEGTLGKKLQAHKAATTVVKEIASLLCAWHMAVGIHGVF